MHKEYSAEQEFPACAFCVRNRHRDCASHEWDPFEPAATYSISRCGCVCKGRIGREFEKLIDLVADYDIKLRKEMDQSRRMIMLAARAAGLADDSIELIRKFDEHARDDEGNILVTSRAQHVDEVITRFLDEMQHIKDRGQAVLSALAGDEGVKGNMADELLARLFNRSDDQLVDDAKRNKPFFGKHPDEEPSHSPHDSDYAELPDEMGWPVD